MCDQINLVPLIPYHMSPTTVLLPPSQNVRRVKTDQKSNFTNFDKYLEKYIYILLASETHRRATAGNT
jgi:hypothetical protein